MCRITSGGKQEDIAEGLVTKEFNMMGPREELLLLNCFNLLHKIVRMKRISWKALVTCTTRRNIRNADPLQTSHYRVKGERCEGEVEKQVHETIK